MNDDAEALGKGSKRHPPLKEEAIRQLCVRAQEGSSSARDQLLQAHMRLVIHLAGCFYRPGCFCEFSDLVQQGCLGLLRAIVKFDLTKRSRGRSVKFATYAHYWIAHFIRREIENNGRTIAIPAHRLQAFKESGLTPQEPRAISIDNAEGWIEDENGLAVARLIDLSDAPDAWCKAWEARQEVEALLKPLAPRKQEVLKQRYGLVEGGNPRSQQQTAQALRVSTTVIGYLERTAIYEIRQSSQPLIHEKKLPF